MRLTDMPLVASTNKAATSVVAHLFRCKKRRMYFNPSAGRYKSRRPASVIGLTPYPLLNNLGKL